jgi:hypothetical protein
LGFPSSCKLAVECSCQVNDGFVPGGGRGGRGGGVEMGHISGRGRQVIGKGGSQKGDMEGGTVEVCVGEKGGGGGEKGWWW